MSTGLFITAAGTEVGKTLITCALAHQLKARGDQVRVLKPVASGFDEGTPTDSDTFHLLTAAGVEPTPEAIHAATPWRFVAPISPDMAAAREGRVIDFAALADHCRAALTGDGVTLIEGIGGTMVPLTARETVRDLIRAFDIPTVLVTGSYLGALSHALTAAGSLTTQGIKIAAIVVSESESAPVPLAEIAQALARFTQAPVLTVPRLSPAPRLWEQVPDLTSLLES
ncbi:MAG: dethiobiotin synthetase [Alphaproteobacteria bacterium]|jgi:dethiobiotin synthetase